MAEASARQPESDETKIPTAPGKNTGESVVKTRNYNAVVLNTLMSQLFENASADATPTGSVKNEKPVPFYQRDYQQSQEIQWLRRSPWLLEQTTRTTSETETQKKPKFSSGDFRGKFCAVVEIKMGDTVHTGVLFVKKCGHWKLCEFNGDKIAGGTAGSYEQMQENGSLTVKVFYAIFDADENKKNAKPAEPTPELHLNPQELEIIDTEDTED